jgi:hypothetical protein
LYLCTFNSWHFIISDELLLRKFLLPALPRPGLELPKK